MRVPNSVSPLTLILADDHKIVRDGLRVLIERSGRFRVIGEASDGRALVEQVLRLKPDIVVTDLGMTELNGIDAVKQLRASGYHGMVIMLSMHDERRYVSRALEAGVNAYLHKDDAFDQILTAIDAVKEGQVWLSRHLPQAKDGVVKTIDDVLSPREREVLQLLAEGKGTKEAAAQLNLSPKTVEVHRLNLFAKLKANSVIDLTRIAIKEGLVQL